MRRSPLLVGVAVLLAACTSSVDDGTTGLGGEPPTPPSSTTVPPAAQLVVHAVGEVTFDPEVVGEAASNPAAALEGTSPVLADADLTIATLSCPVDPGGGSPCTTEQLAALADAGVDVVALGNDALGGADAVATADAVQAAGMTPVGAGADAAAATAPAMLELGGRTVAVLSFSAVGDDDRFAAEGSPGIADGRNVIALAAAVAGAAEEADLVVVSMHWGEPLAQGPGAEDAAVARGLVDAGADLVVGHGAHLLHRFEAYGDGALFLGLGDFTAGGDPPATAATAVARAVWTPDRPVVACLLAARITAPGATALLDPTVTTCPGEG